MADEQPQRIFALTTKGTTKHSSAKFEAGDYLMFGPETRGLPEDVRMQLPYEHWLRLPMIDRKSTRLNSSHVRISYAVFCLKKKKKKKKKHQIHINKTK